MEGMSIDFPIEHHDLETRKKSRIIPIAVGIFVFVLLVLVIAQWAVDSSGGSAKVFSPSVELTDGSGVVYDIQQLEGTPAVVNFFASWCTPCRKEMKEIEEISAVWGERVVFIGINSQETNIDEAKKLVEETGVTYTILYGGDSKLLEEVGAVGMPFTLFVSPDTSIAGRYLTALDSEDLDQYLEKHFG